MDSGNPFKMQNQDIIRLQDLCLNTLSWIKEDMARLKATEDDEEKHDEIRDEILEKPLSVLIRSGWTVPGCKMEAVEYSILLSTGGPAIRITGDIGEWGGPASAVLEAQDWFLPWTSLESTRADGKLLDFARLFYFGE